MGLTSYVENMSANAGCHMIGVRPVRMNIVRMIIGRSMGESAAPRLDPRGERDEIVFSVSFRKLFRAHRVIPTRKLSGHQTNGFGVLHKNAGAVADHLSHR